MSFRDSVHFGKSYGRHIGELVDQLLKAKRFYQKKKYGALVEAWQVTVGDEIATRTKISSFAHGYLSVEVNCAVLMQELGGFMRTAVLEQLQHTPGGEDVVDVRFRLGAGAQ